MSTGELPAGTVTFLFTDIEGSTQLLKRLGGDRYAVALGDHQRILREAFTAHGGHEIDTQGDSFFVAFGRAKDAVSCAIACQRRLAEHSWPEGTELRVRMGIHTGEPAMGGQRYVGLGVNRGARIAAAGHGGQVLVSQTTRELLRDDPVPEVSLRDLGEHQLKDMDGPERIYQLVAPGLEESFPELKTAGSTAFEGREDELAEAAAQELAKRWRRPARRTLIAATLAAAVIGVALGVLLTQGDDSNANASLSANSVGVVDAGSGDITSEIAVGEGPTEVAVGEGSVWVSNVNDSTVSRIDPKSSSVIQTTRVGNGPAGITVGGGAAWVANSLEGTVTRIDVETNLPSQTITVGNGPTGMAYGEGSVWVTNSVDGTVTRIDPATGRTARALPAVVGASGIAVAFNRLWVVSPSAGKVVALAPRTGHHIKEISVGGDPVAVTAGAGSVWVTNRADDTVSRIDPRSLTVTDVIPVGRGPTAVAAGTEAVWVANGGDRTLSRFDPAMAGEAETITVDNTPRGIALDAQDLYVAVASRGTEHRGGTLEVLVGGVDSVDPALAYAFDSWGILTMTNDGLVGFRKVGGVQGVQLVPDLAVSLPAPTEGGRTYTFQVRPGIRYSNGKVVQPDDFRRALERLFELGSPGAPYFMGIVDAGRCTKGKPCDLARGVVTDRAARTVSIRLTAPDGDLLTKLAMPWAYAVPAGSPTRATGAVPVPATGPYRIAGYDRMTRTYRLVRNARFRLWSIDAQPDGYPDTIVFSERFTTTTARFRAVRRGAADIAPGWGAPLSKEELEALLVRFPARVHLNTAFSTFMYFLNTREPPFDDVRVRRAVNFAFDPKAFAEVAGPLYAPTCQVLPPNFPGYKSTCPYAAGSVDGLNRARALVEAAGASGADVTVWAPSPFAAHARYLASVLRLLDFRANVRVVPLDVRSGGAAYFEKVGDSRTRAQMGFSGWSADYPSAAGFIPPILSCASFVPASPTNPNVSQFCDPAIDEKMTRASELQSQDPPAATLLWQEVERDILVQAPLVPTVNFGNADFVSKRVGNYQYNPQWRALLSQIWVK